MKNSKFSEFLNSISYKVSDFETKSSKCVKFWIWKFLMERTFKNQNFPCAKNWSKTFHNVPDMNWCLQKLSDSEFNKKN